MAAGGRCKNEALNAVMDGRVILNNAAYYSMYTVCQEMSTSLLLNVSVKNQPFLKEFLMHKILSKLRSFKDCKFSSLPEKYHYTTLQ